MPSFDSPSVQRRIAAHKQRGEDPWLLLAAAYAKQGQAQPLPTTCVWAEYRQILDSWSGDVAPVLCGKPLALDPWGTSSETSRYLRDPKDRPQLPMCHEHEEELSRRIEAVADRIVRLRKQLNAAPSVVYYIRRSDGRIKIGHSVSPQTRLRELACAAGPLELLATEPGGVEVEQLRHHQWAEHRVHGEWFEPVPDIVAHVELLKLPRWKRPARLR